MWEKLKKHQDTVGVISAVIVLLLGLPMLINEPQFYDWSGIIFIIFYPGWILYSLYKKNYFSRK